MTRFLSESLQAPEPAFRRGIERLERAHGRPSADIRLSAEVMQATRQKLQFLGLDPHDTTARELYHALQERLKTDDAALTRSLRLHAGRHVSAECDAVAGMAHMLAALPEAEQCFALKAARLKTILKKVAPKKTLKRLGYRSLDSMLKHEPPVSILAAASLVESSSWKRSLLDQYKRLTPTDFEVRRLSVVHPTGRRWQKLSQETVAKARHNLLTFPELGAIILLPLPAESPAGAVTASLVLALQGINDIRTGSSFMKLCQVRGDFGAVVQMVATTEPQLQASLFDQPLAWPLVQRFVTRAKDALQTDIFEPHVEQADLLWRPLEQMLSRIEPSLNFWHNSAHLGLVHDRQPVSLNIVDAVLNYVNQLPFERRSVGQYQKALWQELQLRYLKAETVAQTILQALQPQLAAESAPVAV